MKISEIAEQTGQSTSAIRYYESLGLINPSRSDSGYRMYSIAEVERLTLIQAGQQLGFTLEELSLMLRNKSRKLTDVEHQAILDTLEQRKQALEIQQKQIAQQISAIEHLSHNLQATWSKGECFQLENLTKQLKTQ